MRLVSFENLRWVVRHRAWTPYYLKRYWRFAWFRLRHPRVITEGFVFLGKNLEVVDRPGHGRIVLGQWVHLGDGTRLRAHEGTLRIGDKVVFASDVTVNCYLDIEIGASTLIADWTYICDFDHKTDELALPIKDQGLVKSPVRIGPDCWLATKVTVTRGTDIGRGSVIGANSVARGNIPAYSIAAGVPAVVVRDRVERYEADAGRREYLAGLARANEQTATTLRTGNPLAPTTSLAPDPAPLSPPNPETGLPLTPTIPAPSDPATALPSDQATPALSDPGSRVSPGGTASAGRRAPVDAAGAGLSSALPGPRPASVRQADSDRITRPGTGLGIGSEAVGRVGGSGADGDGRDSDAGHEGFSSYSRVGHYVPEVLGEEIQRG